MGYKPKKYGYCWYFEVGDSWGGLELGACFLTDKTPSTHTKNHEMGHGIQNCYWGFLMPFVICIPSAYRYWLRKFNDKKKFANIFYIIVCVITIILCLIACINPFLNWFIIIAILLFAYATILHIWATREEIPQYENNSYVPYDTFWAEADATKRGTEFIESLGEK